MWKVLSNGSTKLYEYKDIVNTVVYCYDSESVTRHQIRGGHLAYGEYEVFKRGNLKYDSFVSFFAALEDGIKNRSHSFWERLNASCAIKSLDELEKLSKKPYSNVGLYLLYSPKTYRPRDKES